MPPSRTIVTLVSHFCHCASLISVAVMKYSDQKQFKVYFSLEFKISVHH